MQVPGALKKVVGFFAPDSKKAHDGRDMWGSRTQFVLAAMGGAIGLGNLLRYPSVVFANNGLQWFIPYLIALTFIAIPVLILEIAAGQTYRGGTVVAFDHIGRRMKGVGLAIMLNGYYVVCYYVPILAWVMKYFQNSFKSPLPWTETSADYFDTEIVANTPPIAPVYSGANNTGSVVSYASYPDSGFVASTVGWCAFTWFIVWLCMFKGVGLTGRVVYFTIGIPIVMVFILMGSSLSLENAIVGVKMYMAEWNGEKLANGQIWQDAAGQIFFSIGVGFGYFTSYASYNAKYSNAVQDSVLIACSNSLFEVVAAFVVFGVVGHLGLKPDEKKLSTFTVAFYTYPEAITKMKGSNVWAVLFFLTLMLLGISSAFALLESIVTLVMDSDWGKKVPRTVVASVTVVVSFLLSLMFCTEYGLWLLDAVDTWVNNLALLFVVWCECMAPNMLYRHKDVWGQVGKKAWIVFNFALIGGQVLGVGVGHAVSPEAGAGVGFGVFIVFTLIAVFISATPTAATPGFFGKSPMLSRAWWLLFYSGNQLTRDLNVIVGQGKNWAIPVFWAPVLRFISGPILALIFSFAYPKFYQVRGDPLHIFSFTVCHMVMLVLAVGFLFPRWLDFLIPAVSKNSEALQYSTAPAVTLDDTEAVQRAQTEARDPMDLEVGMEDRSSEGTGDKNKA